jgi:hypothetical protein
MSSRRYRSVLTSLTAALSFASATAWAQPSICQPPASAETCRTPAYVNGLCAASYKQQCADLLLPEFKARSQAARKDLRLRPKKVVDSTGAERAITRAQELAVSIDPAPVAPVRSIGVPSNTYEAQQRKGAGFSYLPETDAWENNGTAVSSCREKVFKHHFDYEKFRKRALTAKTSEEVFALATSGPFAVNKPMLTRTTGNKPIGGVIKKEGLEGRQYFSLLGTTRIPAPFDASVTAAEAALRAHLRTLGITGVAESSTYAVPKNAFFEDVSFLKTVDRYKNDATYKANVDKLIAAIEPGRRRYAFIDEWARNQHFFSQQRTLGLSDSQRRDIDERLARYQAALERFHEAKKKAEPTIPRIEIPIREIPRIPIRTLTAVQPNLVASNATSVASRFDLNHRFDFSRLLDPVSRAANEVYDLLMEELEHADVKDPNRKDQGCLNLHDARCDWSLVKFVERWTNQFEREKEAEMAWCLESMGGDSLGRLTPDQKADADAVDRHFASVRQQAGAMQLKLKTLRRSVDELSESDQGSDTLGNPDTFAAGYSYDMGWRIKVVERKENTICRLDGDAHAELKTHATVFKNDIQLVDTRHEAKVENGKASLKSHLRLVGKNIYTPVDETMPSYHLAPPGNKESTPTAMATFPVLGVPVTVKGWAELHYGYKVDLDTLAPSGCTPDNIGFKVQAGFTPWTHADGLATVGVGVPGLQVGVKGLVEVIRVDGPVTGSFAVGRDNQNVPALLFTTEGKLNFNFLRGQLDLFAEVIVEIASFKIFGWDGIHVPVQLWGPHTETLPLAPLSQALSSPLSR